jgi:hypothetical protein
VWINVQLTRCWNYKYHSIFSLGGLARVRESLERDWREDILMAEHPTAITPPFTVGSERYSDMSFSSMSGTFSPEGFLISVPV